jgi:hypothetical protein
MEVRVFALLRDVLGVLGFIEAICKARHLKFRVLHFRVKIEGNDKFGYLHENNKREGS